jgi:hypothetical protein
MTLSRFWVARPGRGSAPSSVTYSAEPGSGVRGGAAGARWLERRPGEAVSGRGAGSGLAGALQSTPSCHRLSAAHALELCGKPDSGWIGDLRSITWWHRPHSTSVRSANRVNARVGAPRSRSPRRLGNGVGGRLRPALGTWRPNGYRVNRDSRRSAVRVAEREQAPMATRAAANGLSDRLPLASSHSATHSQGSSGSALMLGAQQRQGVLDALLEDRVGESPVGQSSGDLEGPDHQREDTERPHAR